MARIATTFISREVRRPLIILFTLAVIVYFSAGLLWSLPVWFIVVVLLFLFRDPRREVPSTPLAVVSPVDGEVIAIDDVVDPYNNRQSIRVSIKVSLSGVYITRSPIEGKIVNQWHFPASASVVASAMGPVLAPVLDSVDDKTVSVAKTVQQGDDSDIIKNTRDAMWIQTDEKDDVTLEMSSGLFGWRARCYVRSGERVGQGQRCGFSRIGARIRIYLPARTRVEVEVGEKILAGSNVVATLLH